jgi:hypothetical protein|tara:strand:+ start:100 stop:351 length:252 start_codon:yes stop_codon:yes gene_type:complete
MNTTLTTLFRAILIVLLLWIGYSINSIHSRLDDLGANIDAVYNELSTEMGSISQDFDYFKIDNALVIDLLESTIINKHNEGTQ